MPRAQVVGAIERSRASVSPEVARFAKDAALAAEPKSVARARALLFALYKLGSFCVSVGVPLESEVCLSASMIERFTLDAASTMTASTRLTMRSNLRFVAAATLAHQPPGPIPLSRGVAKAPYSEAELAAYFSLAAHQSTEARCRRAEGLLCLGAGAGLIGADLRCVRGTDVVARSGGVVVVVTGVRPRVVPVRERYHDILVTSARFARERYVIGCHDPYRHNVTTPLISSLSGGCDLPRLETARLRSTWLEAVARALGLKDFLDAAGITCTQRLGDLVAGLEALNERAAVALLGRGC